VSGLSLLPLDVSGVVAVSNFRISPSTKPGWYCSFSDLHVRFPADIALSQKLQEELNFEQQALKDNPSPPEVVTNFIEQGVWTVRIVSLSISFLLPLFFGF